MERQQNENKITSEFAIDETAKILCSIFVPMNLKRQIADPLEQILVNLGIIKGLIENEKRELEEKNSKESEASEESVPAEESAD